MKDLTKQMDITMSQEEQDTLAEEAGEEFPGEKNAKEESIREQLHQDKTGAVPMASAASSSTVPGPIIVDEEIPKKGQSATPATFSDHVSQNSAQANSAPPSYSKTQIPLRPQIANTAYVEPTGDISAEEAKLREKEKKAGKAGLTKEQKEQLAAYEEERARIRKERVQTLAKKLIDRISVWTETDKGKDVTHAFQEKTRLEVENLKMESFGLDILHAIGQTYMSKATALLKSQKFLGIGGFFSRLKDKGTMAKETWNTISSAIDAQMTMEEMAKAEEKGGEEWTEERRVEYERRVTGKILTAAWRGSKFEIQGVLRDVCDEVLGDKKVKLEKRLERAQALMICGEIFAKVC